MDANPRGANGVCDVYCGHITNICSGLDAVVAEGVPMGNQEWRCFMATIGCIAWFLTLPGSP
jgi:hypothetical protein